MAPLLPTGLPGPLRERPDRADVAAEGAAEEEDGDDENGLFSAAYENVSYRDTTDDGFDSELLDSGESISDYELTVEADRIADRLAFHMTLASLWKMAAVAPAEDAPEAVHLMHFDTSEV